MQHRQQRLAAMRKRAGRPGIVPVEQQEQQHLQRMLQAADGPTTGTGADTAGLQSSTGRLGAYSFSNAPLWWTLKISSSDPYGWSTDTGPIFNTISDKVAPSFLTASLGGYSVLAVYVTVVLAVGRLVRSGFGSPTHRIIYEEMPDCTELLELCEGVRTAQNARYPGHLVDEMHLYRILIRLMRSPEILIHITKPKDE